MEFLRNLRSNTKNTPHREPLYDSIVKKQKNKLKKQESNREIESLISNLELQIRKSQEQERISRAQREEAELKKKLERKKAHFYYLQYAEDKIKIIDTFYNQIKRCINEKSSYDHYIRSIEFLNNNIIPEKIKSLLEC